jgi:ribosome biogenesis protein BRX1
MDKKQKLTMINEMAELKNCTKVVYFENRKRADLYLWLANVPNGPSCKFLVCARLMVMWHTCVCAQVRNVHTMAELRLAGNSLRGSRPVLSFDSHFDATPHMLLIKEMLTQVCRRQARACLCVDFCYTCAPSAQSAVH